MHLFGDSQATTTIVPAVSNVGTLGGQGSELGSASNAGRRPGEQRDDQNLTLDGNNTALTGAPGSTTVNGININARNGIITNFNVGDFTARSLSTT